MDEGNSSGSHTMMENYNGERSTHEKYPLMSVHYNATHQSHESWIGIASDACKDMKVLLGTWSLENDWHAERQFLRLNRQKCEDLLCHVDQACQRQPSNTCEFAARKFLAAVKRAKFLVYESSHNNWLLKAVEFWECSQHFMEVSMDLFWWAHIMSLRVKCSSEELSAGPEEPGLLSKAQFDNDKVMLKLKVESTIQNIARLKNGGPEHQLALLLKDRLNDQGSWHPPEFTSFIFCIRGTFQTFSSKRGQSGIALSFEWVYKKKFVVKTRQPSTPTVENMFRHEFDILDKYRSPYIVVVVGYWEVQSKLNSWPRPTLCPFLLMEAMEYNLEELIREYKAKRTGGFSALETIKLMLPIAKALRFLHGKDVAHRDIKPQNIMCNNASADLDDAIVKLIDFGEAVEGVSRMNGPAGTKGYMDPEMWKKDPKTGKWSGYNLFRADVFSFAMVFAELLTWRSPWEAMGVPPGKEVQTKLNGNSRPPLPQSLPDCVSFIVQCCWCAEPPARPTFKDICCMLQKAELLLLDETFVGECDDLFWYDDGDGVERSIVDREFWQGQGAESL